MRLLEKSSLEWWIARKDCWKGYPGAGLALQGFRGVGGGYAAERLAADAAGRQCRPWEWAAAMAMENTLPAKMLVVVDGKDTAEDLHSRFVIVCSVLEMENAPPAEMLAAVDGKAAQSSMLQSV